MKKVIFLFVLCVIVSCKKEYITYETIVQQPSSNNTYKDTLFSLYSIYYGNVYKNIYYSVEMFDTADINKDYPIYSYSNTTKFDTVGPLWLYIPIKDMPRKKVQLRFVVNCSYANNPYTNRLDINTAANLNYLLSNSILSGTIIDRQSHYEIAEVYNFSGAIGGFNID